MKDVLHRSTAHAAMLIAMLGLVLGLTACDSLGDDEETFSFPADRGIQETVEAESVLSTLRVAVDTAGIADALSGSGPLTIFAPRNTAFTGLDTEALLADPDLLRNVLRYHVVEGNLGQDDLEDGEELTTLQGESLTVSREGNTLRINGAPIASSNPVSNGVMHVTNRVLFPSVAQEVRFLDQTNDLTSALDAVGLTGAIEGSDKVTVFAPVNSAFSALGGQGADSLLANSDLLERVLGYHVVGQELKTADIEDGMTVETLQGEELDFTVDDDAVLVDGVPVTTANIETANGVVHLVGQVLQGSMTVTERADYTTGTSQLAAALETAELESTLDGEGPFTVFAPTDAGFGTINADTLLGNAEAGTPSQPDLLRKVLTGHVVQGEALRSEELMDGDQLTTVEGAELSIGTGEDGNLLVNGVPLSTTNVKTANGVIHLINGVLLESATVAERAMLMPQTATLASALETAGLQSTLDEGGPFTVFAPINAAFDAINTDTLLQQPDLLEEVLRYHVVSGELTSDDIMDGGMATTLEGADLDFSVDEEGNVMVNGASVTTLDLPASNGVIHLIGQVLLETTNVAERTALMPSFSTTADAIEAAGLTSTLEGMRPFTVFAPINAAADTLSTLIDSQNQEALDEIMRYHVIEGEALTAEDLMQGDSTRTTLQGSELTFSVSGDTLRVNGAAILMPNLQVSNGVLHGVDMTLLPPEEP